MERKRVKKFIYAGLGFPIALIDVPLIKARGIWTPAIDYNKLQKAVIIALCHKLTPLTGNEIHFIRTFFEMTLEDFGKQFGMTHVAVINWERAKNRPAKASPTTELCIRLFILEKLKINNEIFRETFREFDIQRIAKEQKTLAKEPKPLFLPSSYLHRKSSLRASL